MVTIAAGSAPSRCVTVRAEAIPYMPHSRRAGHEMSMVLIGRRLSADELSAVREDASIVTALLYGNLEDEYSDMPEPDLDINKAWHGIHFLLTGSAWDIQPGAGEAILGGDEV